MEGQTDSHSDYMYTRWSCNNKKDPQKKDCLGIPSKIILNSSSIITGFSRFSFVNEIIGNIENLIPLIIHLPLFGLFKKLVELEITRKLLIFTEVSNTLTGVTEENNYIYMVLSHSQ